MPRERGGARWRVISAEFEKSATGIAELPEPQWPELAVAGRSNVGKSSLLNAFAGHRGLARVSRTPGRTRLLNCFHVRLASPEDVPVDLRWVDLPGYGYVAAARVIRDAFGPMIEEYLSQREALRALILLVDARRGVKEPDLELIEFMSARAVPTLVCATKVDKLKAADRGLVARQFATQLGVDSRDILLTSASSGLGLGDAQKGEGLARELGELAQKTP